MNRWCRSSCFSFFLCQCWNAMNVFALYFWDVLCAAVEFPSKNALCIAPTPKQMNLFSWHQYKATVTNAYICYAFESEWKITHALITLRGGAMSVYTKNYQMWIFCATYRQCRVYSSIFSIYFLLNAAQFDRYTQCTMTNWDHLKVMVVADTKDTHKTIFCNSFYLVSTWPHPSRFNQHKMITIHTTLIFTCWSNWFR